MGKETNYIIYRIYYSNIIAYVGQTRQELKDRLYQHYFVDKDLDYRATNKIEFAYCDSWADMNVYEMYYINKMHPFQNRFGTSTDNLTILINKELTFDEYDVTILERYNKNSIPIINRSSNLPKDKYAWETKNFEDRY